MNFKTSIKWLAALIVLPAIIFVSCQKELSGDPLAIVPEELPDLVTEVTTSLVSGFVTDNNDAAVSGATVRVGSATTVTDKYGYFEVSGARVVQNAAVVAVNKAGFFPGIKTFLGTANKGGFFRIKLLPKTEAGNFAAGAGGSVNLVNGLKIDFAASSIVVAGSNAPYTGTVHVAAHWINPTSNELYRIMPGDLRGLDTAGYLRTLTTYGMAAVALTGDAGESLQIDSNRSATITMPIPASILGNAPNNIPLWYFDEARGLWKQEGSAVKTGSTYVGTVKHFSFWNCDWPANFVQLNCRVVDGANRPMRNALVKIYRVTNPNDARFDFTDTSGFVSGAVPANAELVMEIYSDPSCINFIHTRRVTTETSNIALGDIIVPAANAAVINGNVVNCSGAPVTNGFVVIQKGQFNYRTPLNSNGTFSYTTSICDVSVPVVLIAEDLSALQGSAPVPFTVVTGNNNAGTLTACGGVSLAQYVTFTVNGTAYDFALPADSIYQSFSQNSTVSLGVGASRMGGGTYQDVNLFFTALNIAPNTVQTLNSFNTSYIADTLSIATPISVNINEYGAIGEYVSGNFVGTLTGGAPANRLYNINCSFRFIRYY